MTHYDAWEPTIPLSIPEIRKILDRLEKEYGDTATVAFDGGYNGVTVVITTSSLP